MWLKQANNGNSPRAVKSYYACAASAGISASILSLAHFHPEIWLISIFSLVPYLHQIRKSDWRGVLVSGISLASLYAILTMAHESMITPQFFILKFGLLNLIFVVFGVGIKLLKKSLWFNSVFIAALWLPLEFVLVRYIGLGAIFTFPNHGHDLIYRLATIFGFLTISFFIILANSIILLLFDHIFINFNLEVTHDEFKSYKIAVSFEIPRLINDRHGTINSRAPPEVYL